VPHRRSPLRHARTPLPTAPTLSGIYYPTAPLMMHVIIEIADHLNQFKNDSMLRDVIVLMKIKFLKY
jgi:hypothetical protein